MILITGASGKTGKAIVSALAKRGASVRVLVRKEDQAGLLKSTGASEVVIGDIRSADDWTRAVKNVRVVYHICPNVQPDEEAIGATALAAARAAGVDRFVYHSVLHPQTEDMPHHWKKLRVEEKILKSGLSFTILQPCAYMQNILANWHQIIDQGVYPVPYAADARLSMVDLEDVAQVAATVLTEDGHAGAIYELAGKEALTQLEVAEILSRELGRAVRTEVVDRTAWEARARSSGMNEYAVQTLLKMFVYYEHNGLWGNSKVLEWLIGRPPHSFAEFVAQHASPR